MLQLSGKPADLDEMFDGPKLLIAGEDGRVDPLGRRHTESIGIRDGVFAFNLGRCPYHGEVQGYQFQRQLFQSAQGLLRLGRSDPALDDVEEFSPVDPIEECPRVGLLLLVEGRLHALPARFFVKQGNEREAIEYELFAHGAFLPDGRGGDQPRARMSLRESP